VDVGTGFYVEKIKEDARVFYEEKVKDLQNKLGQLEGVVNGKTENLRVVDEVVRQHILRGNTSGAAGGGESATPGATAAAA
jgi:prefoldin alpha subunit